MTTATTAKAPAKRTTARKATRKTSETATPRSVDVNEAPAEIQLPKTHPIYGTKKLYYYHPKDGSAPIIFPHISTCRPTALFFYENRNVDEMHQAFSWMDLCEIPTSIGRRLFLLPDEEQGELLRQWFGGLNLTPAPEVSPPGES